MTEPWQEEIHREMVECARRSARRTPGEFAHYDSNIGPTIVGVGLFLGFLFAVVFIVVDIATGGATRRNEELTARDKFHLECRKSGGRVEYFGTQGDHCIGGK